ncbi:hypothetical protein [Citricoccus alkalitolerans]|uniref:DNA-binding protein n=1 Tax=Citricoccus alkalitolerans TaxID=246603 RepID=A0ABV8XWY3_9MICC
MFVMTMDQRASSRGPDRVAALIEGLIDQEENESSRGIVRPFQRTAGDEVQGVVDRAEIVVGIALSAARSGHWSVGIGVGQVRQPLPAETRAGAGPAFEYARIAVERAKHSPGRVAVAGPVTPGGPTDSTDSTGSAGSRTAAAGGNEVAELLEGIEAGLQLLAELEHRRSEEGQDAGRLVDAGKTQREAAHALGVTQQAVSSRLRTGLWGESRRLAAVVSGMLERVDRLVDGGGGPGGQG